MKNGVTRTTNLDIMLFLKEMDGRLERLETCMGNLTARTSFETSLLKNSASKLDFLLDLLSQSVATETVAKEVVAKKTVAKEAVAKETVAKELVAKETVVVETGAEDTSEEGRGALKRACSETFVDKKIDCEVPRADTADTADTDMLLHHKQSATELNALSLPFQPKTYASICVQNNPEPVCWVRDAPRQVANSELESINNTDHQTKADAHCEDSRSCQVETNAKGDESEKHSIHSSNSPVVHHKQSTTAMVSVNSDDDWRIDEEDLLRAANIAMATTSLDCSTTTTTSLGDLLLDVSRLTKWSVDEECVGDSRKHSPCANYFDGEASHKKKGASTCRICKGNHRSRVCPSPPVHVRKKKTQTMDADTSIAVTTVTEPIHCGAFDWTIRPHRPLAMSLVFHSGVFYTRKSGYRMQLKAEVDRLHGDAYFAVRIMKGAFDSDLQWPFTGCVKISIGKDFPDSFEFPTEEATDGGGWKCADGGVLHQPHRLRETVVSGYHGPFNISRFMHQKYIKLACIVKDGID